MTQELCGDAYLFGTVEGMMEAFNIVASSEGAAKPYQLADSISKALVTTWLGLVVAIPAMMAFSFFRNKIDTLTITTPGRVLTLSKAGGEWQLLAPRTGAQPGRLRADFTAVDALVSRLNTLKMKSLVAPDAGNVAEYGLDKPAATIQLGSAKVPSASARRRRRRKSR